MFYFRDSLVNLIKSNKKFIKRKKEIPNLTKEAEPTLFVFL